jgi:hypothetical protein
MKDRILLQTLSLAMTLSLLATGAAWASEEHMPQMPQAKATRTYTIQSAEQGEDLQDQRGYGDQESMVRMMNLMMVEGSGYEGMDMSGMAMPSQPAVAPKAPPPASDMRGTAIAEKPSAAASPSAAATASVPSPYRFEAKMTPAPPKVGTNVLVVSIRTQRGQPAKNLKIRAQVYATDMDMGVEEPRVKEISPGVYQVKASFSMPGAWAVKLLLPGEEAKVFNFEVQ